MDNGVADDIKLIAEFMTKTCRRQRKTSEYNLRAVMYRAVLQTLHADDNVRADVITLTTGSTAEFYIEPMLPCVGDIDVMCHWNTELAIPAGQSPPTQLPAQFHNYVKVHEIVETQLPGYVYLESRYLLTECVDGAKHYAVEYDGGQFVSYRGYKFRSDEGMHGPAVSFSRQGEIHGSLPVDIVLCIRCLSWPTQAADWPTRHRKYDWPDSLTVYRVVSNGCDVVPVAHHQCRGDEWVGASQWRLSFSRAEVLLLNSWMPVQQIVYHLLRYFAKTEQLTDSLDYSRPRRLVNNYHIKTLMLWACEMKPKCLWTKYNLIKLCVELLLNFADWLTAEVCPHYFINNCNLIESTFNVKAIVSKLSPIDETCLSTWLIDSYIRKCSPLCPGSVSRLFDNIGTSPQLQNAVSALVDWRLNNDLPDMLISFAAAEINFTEFASIHSLSFRSCSYLLSELAKNSVPLYVYFAAIAFAHVSFRISIYNAFTDELMDVLATLVGQCSVLGTTYSYNQCRSEVFLSKAAKLMKTIAKSYSTDQLIKIELSKAYLYRTLRCTDSYSDSIYCLANVYLAVLHYATGQYQTAMDHCRPTLVMGLWNHKLVHMRAIQGDLLPKVDDYIDSVLGLSTLYKYVLIASLNTQEQHKCVTAFTPELFACFLNICCHRVSRSCQQFSQTAFVDEVRDKRQLFIADALLFKLLHRLSEYNNFHRKTVEGKCQHPAPSSAELNTSTLVELLQKSAVEHLTTYRQLISRDFSSVAAVVTTDFEALYEYKCGNYHRCLHLSWEHVHELLYAVRLSSVPILPVFIQLMDDDIASLTALTLLVSPECRNFPRCVCITQLTLSLYLMIKCQSKLRHSVTSMSQTVEYIEVAQRTHTVDMTLDHLALKLAERIGSRELT